MEEIQQKRRRLWEQYFIGLQTLAGRGFLRLPQIPAYATNNVHMFYIVCRSLDERTALIAHLKAHDILSVFHYLALHRSDYYAGQYAETPNCPSATCMPTVCCVCLCSTS